MTGLSQLTGGDSTAGMGGDSRDSPESVAPMPPGASPSESPGAVCPLEAASSYFLDPAPASSQSDQKACLPRPVCEQPTPSLIAIVVGVAFVRVVLPVLSLARGAEAVIGIVPGNMACRRFTP